MSWLLTSDLHLTDRPQDAYRFGIFPWLTQAQIQYKTEATFILGDLTDRKDNHSAFLVNQTVEGLRMLRPPVYILKGNHDYVDQNNPFFEFLNAIDGIRFVSKPTFIKKYWVMMVPHQQDQASFDAAIAKSPPEAVLMLHQTLDGAFIDGKSHLSGFSASAVASANVGWVYSGDVHMPQELPGVSTGRYVGSPYHVRFGDDFEPRVILQEPDYMRNLYFPAPRKVKRTVRRRERDGNLFFNTEQWARPGDHVKLTVVLGREEVVQWPSIKAALAIACVEHGLKLFGIDMVVIGADPKRINKVGAGDNKTVFKGFCEAEAVPDNIKQAGQELLK